MKAEEIIAALEQKFGGQIKQKKLDTQDPFFVVEPGDLLDVCRYLRDDPALRFDLLNCVTGVDYFEPDAKKAPKAGFEPHLEVVYHLSSFAHHHRIVLKVMLPRWKDDKAGELPEIPSVAHIWRTADWHERETYEMYGVLFTGHPDLRRILLSEDWIGYPLRKDYEFPLEYHGIRGR
jgi:NADH-quinone oxidoreductase subunit C